jgi:hypothetical protein
MTLTEPSATDALVAEADELLRRLHWDAEHSRYRMRPDPKEDAEERAMLEGVVPEIRWQVWAETERYHRLVERAVVDGLGRLATAGVLRRDLSSVLYHSQAIRLTQEPRAYRRLRELAMPVDILANLRWAARRSRHAAAQLHRALPRIPTRAIPAVLPEYEAAKASLDAIVVALRRRAKAERAPRRWWTPESSQSRPDSLSLERSGPDSSTAAPARRDQEGLL